MISFNFRFHKNRIPNIFLSFRPKYSKLGPPHFQFLKAIDTHIFTTYNIKIIEASYCICKKFKITFDSVCAKIGVDFQNCSNSYCFCILVLIQDTCSVRIQSKYGYHRYRTKRLLKTIFLDFFQYKNVYYIHIILKINPKIHFWCKRCQKRFSSFDILTTDMQTQAKLRHFLKPLFEFRVTPTRIIPSRTQTRFVYDHYTPFLVCLSYVRE